MATEKQLLANRKNALRSTGPKTELGKSVSSRNSLKHGLRSQRIVIEGEDQQEFDIFCDQLTDYLSPEGPLEKLLVDRIAASSWRLRRTGHIEAQIFDQMRNSLAAERTPDQREFFVDLDNNNDIDFPSRSRFGSFQEAKSSWDATEDGLAYAEGGSEDDRSGPDSFSKFLKNSRSSGPDVPQSQPVNIVDAISDMKNKCQGQPEMFSRLSELQDTFEIIGKHSKSVHIPSLRQYLQDLRPLIDTSPNLTDKYAADFDDAISDLLHLEMAIRQKLRPNLGQAISFDLKGQDLLTKFTRYESQIQRGLFKAIHELDRLKAVRQSWQSPTQDIIDLGASSE